MFHTPLDSADSRRAVKAVKFAAFNQHVVIMTCLQYNISAVTLGAKLAELENPSELKQSVKNLKSPEVHCCSLRFTEIKTKAKSLRAF